MQAKCRGVRPSLFVFSVSALPYWVLKSLEWVEAWFLSTNCLSFDWWIFDLVTFKNYKRETYLHKQNRCYFRPVVQSSNMEGCVVALRVRFISQFWAFCCNFICCTRKTTLVFWRRGEDNIHTLFSMAQHFFYVFLPWAKSSQNQ